MRTLLDFDKIVRLPSDEDYYEIYRRYIHYPGNDVPKKESRIQYGSYEEYFEDMGISDEQKKARVELANDLNDLLLAFFIFCEMQRIFGEPDLDYQRQYLHDKYMTIIFSYVRQDIHLENHGLLEGYLEEWVKKRTKDIVDKTNEHLDDVDYRRKQRENDPNATDDDYSKDTDDWWLSDDRAFIIGAEDSNSVENYEDFADAIESGCTMKQWCDVRDSRERKSHLAVGGTVIPITDPFIVGGELMLFPRDDSMGASDEQIYNCRCWLEYS